MNLILHIFFKDARRLWPQIAAFVAMLVLRLYNDPLLRNTIMSDEREMFLTLLTFLSLYILIASLIHQENLIGDRQYWLTRPMQRNQLLFAKALFAATFISLPFFLGQMTALRLFGFQVFQVAPIVLLKTILFTAEFALPIMALASIIRNWAQMMLWPILAFILLLTTLTYLRYPGWYDLNWIRESLCLAILILGTAFVILIQYFGRRAMVARIVTALVFAAASWMLAMPPESWTFPIAALFSNRSVDKSQIRFSLDQSIREPYSGTRSWAGNNPNNRVLRMPIRVDAVPPGIGFYASAVQFTIRENETTKWNSKYLMYLSLIQKYQDHLWLEIPVDSEFYKRIERSTVQIAGSIEMTLVEQQPRKIRNRECLPDLGLSIIHSSQEAADLHLYSPWPRTNVANTNDGCIVTDISSDKCAPWPFALSLSPAELSGSLRFISARPQAPSTLECLIRRPVARIRRSFEFNNLRPHDYFAQ
jgi:hypothetical protein